MVFALRGGLELKALSRRFNICSQRSKNWRLTHAVLGFRPSWGLAQRLPKLIGNMKAKELSFTAKTISGIDAKDLGIAIDEFSIR